MRRKRNDKISQKKKEEEQKKKRGPNGSLNKKQKLFVQYFRKYLDKRKAYIKAGYVWNKTLCDKLFNNPKIQAELKGENKVDKNGDKRGRASILFDVQEILFREIRKGMSYNDACAIAKINPKTFYDWKKKGFQDLIDGKETDYSNFCNHLKEVELTAKSYSLDVIHAASREYTEVKINEEGEQSTKTIRGAWQPAAFYLSRKYPDEWGEKKEVDKVFTAEEIAKLVKDTQDKIMNSVPVKQPEGEENK